MCVLLAYSKTENEDFHREMITYNRLVVLERFPLFIVISFILHFHFCFVVFFCLSLAERHQHFNG